MMRVDAHQHFWKLSRGDYDWLTPELGPIHRDFLPADMVPLLRRAGIEATVLVQAAATEAETHFLLSLADQHDFIAGVVGWTDFEADDAAERIAALARNRRLKGLRPMIQDIPDDTWMLRPALDRAFGAMTEQGLVFDALVLPRHLGHLLELLRRHPRLRAVVDHGAKPDIAGGRFDGWARDIGRIAEETGAFCKLSGLITEAGPDWSVDSLRPYVEHILACFGPGRIVWGSDWPVCTLAGSYDAWCDATDALLAGLGEAERGAILGGNAIRLYGLYSP